MNSEELILPTIKKVYAIREATERRTALRLHTPVLGHVQVALSGISLSRDQVKDIAAFITVSCSTGDRLMVMEKISAFKTKSKVHRPTRVWLSYAGLLLPVVLATAVEGYLVYRGLYTETMVLAAMAGLELVAMLIGILLYAYLSYDPDYRREALEHEVWKAIDRECQRRMKQGVKVHKQLPPASQGKPAVSPKPAAPQATVPQKQPGTQKKL